MPSYFSITFYFVIVKQYSKIFNSNFKIGITDDELNLD